MQKYKFLFSRQKVAQPRKGINWNFSLNLKLLLSICDLCTRDSEIVRFPWRFSQLNIFCYFCRICQICHRWILVRQYKANTKWLKSEMNRNKMLFKQIQLLNINERKFRFMCPKTDKLHLFYVEYSIYAIKLVST